MNIEKFREYCLSLGDDVKEKTPFGKFARKYESILVFYVRGHMFCLIDIDDFRFVDVCSTPGEVMQLKAEYLSVSNPANPSLRHWIQLYFNGDISDGRILELVRRAYDIVNDRYAPKRLKKP